MEFKHYPVIDRETTFMGLEIIDWGVIFLVSISIATVLFIMHLKFLSILSFVFSLFAGYAYVRKKKEGKERGYLIRWIHSKLRGKKVIY